MRRICVFCGAHAGARPAYAEAARELGTLLAARGLGLVTGGGRVGLMGIVADAALAAGGEAIGVIPRALVAKELAHPGLSELVVVETMHARKAAMHALADAFVTLPGGIGSLEEALEALAWLQLDLHRKPAGIVNVEGYYDPLLAQLDRAVAEGFVLGPQRETIVVGPTPAAVLDRFAAWRPPATSLW
ncbi:MAG: TIGR00730 family Rossman fold protein [Planctomycetota bacterium]